MTTRFAVAYLTLSSVFTAFSARAVDPQNPNVAFFYHEKPDIAWRTNERAKSALKKLREDTKLASELNGKLKSCVATADSQWNRGMVSSSQGRIKYFREIEACLKMTYVIDDVPLVQGISILTEQCDVEDNGGDELLVDGVQVRVSEMSQDEIFEKTGCRAWSVPFTAWAHIGTLLKSSLMDFEQVIAKSREDAKLAGGVLGALAFFVFTNSLVADAGQLGVSIRGTDFALANGDLSAVTGPLPFILGGIGGAATAFLTDQIAQRVSLAVNAGTIQAYRNAMAIFEKEEYNVMVQIGKKPITIISNGFISRLRTAQVGVELPLQQGAAGDVAEIAVRPEKAKPHVAQ
jgi:uncharacterized membrane protein